MRSKCRRLLASDLFSPAYAPWLLVLSCAFGVVSPLVENLTGAWREDVAVLIATRCLWTTGAALLGGGYGIATTRNIVSCSILGSLLHSFFALSTNMALAEERVLLALWFEYLLVWGLPAWIIGWIVGSILSKIQAWSNETRSRSPGGED